MSLGLDRSGLGDRSPPSVLSRVGAFGSRGGSSTGESEKAILRDVDRVNIE